MPLTDCLRLQASTATEPAAGGFSVGRPAAGVPEVGPLEEEGAHAQSSWTQHFLLNVAIVGCTTFLGVNMPTVLAPLDLIGGTCSPLIVFILPAKIFLATENKTSEDRGKEGMAKVMMWVGCDSSPNVHLGCLDLPHFTI